MKVLLDITLEGPNERYRVEVFERRKGQEDGEGVCLGKGRTQERALRRAIRNLARMMDRCEDALYSPRR